MLTIDELIKIKLKEKKRVYKVLEVPELGGQIKVLVPNVEELEDINSVKIKNTNGEINVEKTSREKVKKIIYYQVVEPKLSNEKLITHYNCKKYPEEVVYKIMSDETADNLATAILTLFDAEASKYRVRVVETAKN